MRANALPGAVIGVPGCRDIIVPRPEWRSAVESAEDWLPATPAPPSAHIWLHGAKSTVYPRKSDTGGFA